MAGGFADVTLHDDARATTCSIVERGVHVHRCTYALVPAFTVIKIGRVLLLCWGMQGRGVGRGGLCPNCGNLLWCVRFLIVGESFLMLGLTSVGMCDRVLMLKSIVKRVW